MKKHYLGAIAAIITLAFIFIGQGVRPAAAEPDLWSKLSTLTQRAGFAVQVSANRDVYKVGDRLVLTCRVDRPGYLNVINVDRGSDKAIVLFPNRLHRDNRVGPGQLTIPSPDDSFVLSAEEPRGRSLVVVFHTDKPINAFEESSLAATKVFRILSQGTMKGFRVEERRQEQTNQPVFGAGRIIVRVE